METSNFCSEISVIPQYIGTCWFNAILMNSFYSQAMRKLMIKKVSKTWDKTNKVLKFFKTILKKSYNTEDKKIIEMFYKTKPQMLLITYANMFDLDLKKLIKDFKYGGYSSYISIFLKKINVKVLDIVYYNTINKCLLNSFKHMNKSSININKNEEKEEIEQILTDIPDVLVLYNTELYDEIYDYNTLLLKNNNIKIYESDNYNINDETIQDIKEYKDEIRFLGYVYKLDSIILANYNKNYGSHAISGITCNNNKYIYNGWCKGTIDPALQQEKIKKLKPYPLIKYDWNLREDKKFCFKPEYNETIEEQKLCFSFNKGRRILIYVKEKKEETSSLIRSSSYSNLSNKKEEFKKFHDSVKLDRDEIISELNKKNIIYNKSFSIEILKKILINKLKKEAELLNDEKEYEYFTSLPITNFKEEELIKIRNNYYLKKNLFYYLFIYNATNTYLKILKYLIIQPPDSNIILLQIEQIKELIFYFFETEDLKEIYEKYLKDDKAHYNYKIKIDDNFNLETNENYDINLILLLLLKTFGIQFFVKILNLKDTKEFMKYIIDEKNNFLENYYHIHYTSNIKDFLEFLNNKCNMPFTNPENERIEINSIYRNFVFLFYYYIIYDNPFEKLTVENIKNILFKFYEVEMNNYELLNTEIEKEENEEIKLKVKDTLLKIQEKSVKGGKKKLLKRY